MTSTRLTTPRRGVSGVTLLELLIASALGAMLLIAMAQVAQVFTQQVTYLREEADDELEKTAETIATDLRRAWSVTSISAQSFSVEDPHGAVTTYALVGDELTVTRPSGDSGVLVDDITSFVVTADTTSRYREATETDEYGSWFTSSGSGSTSGLILQSGQELGLGFVASSNAPAQVELVNGVDELRLETQIEQLTITVDMINMTEKVFGHLYGYPPNNNPPGTVSDESLGNMTVTLYEARSPGSGVPHGPSLASATIALADLPNNSYEWRRDITNLLVNPPNGYAYGWWQSNTDVNLSVSVPSAPVSLSVPSLATVIEPGRAYTLVLGVDDYAALIVRARGSSSGLEAVAHKSNSGGSFSSTNMAVPFSLEGTNTYTQTTEHNVVRNVTLTLTRADGATHTVSAAVTTQVVADDPWFGSVPGDLPTIQIP